MRSYSSRTMLSVGDGRGASQRVLGIVCLVLAVALAVALAVLLPRSGDRGRAHTFIVSQMLEECENAVSTTRKLSRTASISSYEAIARVRSSVYAVDTLNRAEHEATGQYMIPTETFTRIYDLLDNYNSKLIMGSQTGDLQTQLTGELDQLHLLVENLQ